MRRLLALTVVLVALPACEGDRQPGPSVTGRVTTRTTDTVCVSRDPRQATSQCVQVRDLVDPGAVEEVDVGECASITTSQTSSGGEARIEVTDDAACAAGDLGDEAPDR